MKTPAHIINTANKILETGNSSQLAVDLALSVLTEGWYQNISDASSFELAEYLASLMNSASYYGMEFKGKFYSDDEEA